MFRVKDEQIDEKNLDLLIKFMDYDQSGSIEVVEFFKFMFMFEEYFRETDVILQVSDEKGLMD